MNFDRLGADDSPYYNFPLLIPRFPDTLADLAALQHRWPHLRGELVRTRLHYEAVMQVPRKRWRGKLVRSRLDYEAVMADPKKRHKRAFIEYYRETYHFPPDADCERLYRQFTGFTRLADAFVRDLVREYFHSDRWRNILIGCPIPHDPVKLLGLCFLEAPTAAGRKRAFEARRKLVLAQLLYEISLSQRDDLLEHDLDLLAKLFERSFFTGRTERVMVRSAHDPFREFQTAAILDGPVYPAGMKVIERPLTFRHFRSYGQELPVYFEAGAKLRFSHLGKMLRKGIRDPDEIKDLRRYLFVFRNEWEMRRGLRVLRECVHNAGGVVHNHSSNLWRDGPADKANPHSSPDFRQKSWLVKLDGRWFEGMVQTLPEFLDGKYSMNGKKHELYKLRQFLASTSPIIFPPEHYHQRWDDPAVVEELRREILAENFRIFSETV